MSASHVQISADDVCRFFAKIDHRGPNECWPWKGDTVSGTGYGHLSMHTTTGFRKIRAHRLAYTIANDAEPGELCVCHRCDNPRCCNPAHLFLGTSAENNADRSAKGRTTHGSAHHSAKLTEADVVAIRAAYAAGGVSQNALASQYGVSKPSVADVVHRRKWRHVA